jgi:hypothetical protein
LGQGARTRFPLTNSGQGVSMEPSHPRFEAGAIHVVSAP